MPEAAMSEPMSDPVADPSDADRADDFADRYPPPDPRTLDIDQQRAHERIEQRRGRLPAPFTALLASPVLAEAFDQLSSALQQGVLPADVREAVFLMRARRQRCRYLWTNHVGKALEAGLDGAAVAAIGQGRIPMAPVAVRAAAHFEQALALEHRVPQPIHDAAVAALGARGVVELTAFCGFASSVALLLNVRQPGSPTGAEAPF